MSFKVNSSQQISFNDSVFSLTAREKKALDNSWAKIFADEIFPNIDEERFSVLYSSKASRPNAPVNVIIGALIIKELLCLQIALSHFAAWRRNVLFRKISRAEVYRVHSIVLYFPMCFFRAGRKNFTVFTTLDFSTAFLLPSHSIYSEIKPKCRSASLIASTFSGGQG